MSVVRPIRTISEAFKSIPPLAAVLIVTDSEGEVSTVNWLDVRVVTSPRLVVRVT